MMLPIYLSIGGYYSVVYTGKLGCGLLVIYVYPCVSNERVSHMNCQHGQSQDLACWVILSGSHTGAPILIA